MDDVIELTDAQKLGRLSALGILAAFVEAYEGYWDHWQWLELMSYVDGLGYPLSEAVLREATEREREAYLKGTQKEERPGFKPSMNRAGFEQTLVVINETDSFLSSLMRIKEEADGGIGPERKKALLDILSEKFTREVRERTEKGAWIPKKMVSDVEELMRRLSS